ncbi:MAG: hypothetical protein JJ992_26910 [Planctomycetes bacterium]|nr:hypothetical protein [Planctomycetota bacterium]
MSRKSNRNLNRPMTGARAMTRSRGRRSPYIILHGRRGRSGERRHNSFAPPEDWHAPTELASRDFRIVVQTPGRGLRHVVTPDDIRRRLAVLPEEMLAPLEVVQLSRMTRKKNLFPCYGMQWGCAIYLYPIATELVEYFARPPRPAQEIEAATWGGRWQTTDDGTWRLIWTEDGLRDFYLNNVLMHELGHLLDDRNRSYVDRERYAEWFAIRFGQSVRNSASRARRDVRRRHHAT